MPASFARYAFQICQRITWLVAACVVEVISVAASAADVLVVTDQQHPVSARIGMRVIDLDAPGRIVDSALAAGLPADPTRAAAIARQRLQGGSDALQKRLALAYQGVIEAWSLGITKIPAVIVDRQYVVYGVPDVDRALELIDQYRSTRP